MHNSVTELDQSRRKSIETLPQQIRTTKAPNCSIANGTQKRTFFVNEKARKTKYLSADAVAAQHRTTHTTQEFNRRYVIRMCDYSFVAVLVIIAIREKKDTNFQLTVMKSQIHRFLNPRPASSFITSGCTKRRRSNNSEIFYTLSSDEEKYNFKSGAMKRVASAANILRRNNKDGYLQQRYNQRPPLKYNFPESTSWRYGWWTK